MVSKTKNEHERFGKRCLSKLHGAFDIDLNKSWINIVVGVLFLGVGIIMTSFIVYVLFVTGARFYEGAFEAHPTASLVLFIVMAVCIGLTALLFIAIGEAMLLRRSRIAHRLAEACTVFLCACILCEIMLEGITELVGVFGIVSLFLLGLFALLDPALAEERRLQHKLRDLQTREDAERGVLGRAEDGKGYIALNLFNLFWIFTIGAFVGDVVETIFHYMVVVPGEFQIRAGLLWGPFSPIYGFGAVILTLMLNRFYKAPVLVVFLISAVVGGAFEYLTSWFLEYAFGILAWDYTGNFLNIDGRTDFVFMCMWGILGVAWIKVLLPEVLKIVNLIPWKWRYTITAICATFMIFDGAMTLIALDCWYIRLAGGGTDGAAYMDFFARHFDNAFMQSRFQSMGIDVSRTTRI